MKQRVYDARGDVGGDFFLSTQIYASHTYIKYVVLFEPILLYAMIVRHVVLFANNPNYQETQVVRSVHNGDHSVSFFADC